MVLELWAFFTEEFSLPIHAQKLRQIQYIFLLNFFENILRHDEYPTSIYGSNTKLFIFAVYIYISGTHASCHQPE